jgi:hypothetical protein
LPPPRNAQEELEEKRRTEDAAKRARAEALKAEMKAANQYQMQLKVSGQAGGPRALCMS